jgi:hypothetical protein
MKAGGASNNGGGRSKNGMNRLAKLIEEENSGPSQATHMEYTKNNMTTMMALEATPIYQSFEL